MSDSQFTHDTICLYHKNCLDGIAAAWVVWKFFNGAVDLVRVQYGDDLQEIFGSGYSELIGKKVICVDFAFDLNTTKTLGEICDLTVLDHHDTAQKQLASIAYSSFVEARHDAAKADYSLVDNNGMGRPFVVVDNRHSGARLAWEWFFGPVYGNLPDPIKFAEDYDMWRFNYGITKAWCAAAFSGELSVEQFDTYYSPVPEKQRKINDLMEIEGKAIQRQIEKTAKALCRSARRFKIDDYDVPAVNANTIFRNEIGSILSTGEPFSITYTDSRDSRQYSLRSKKGVTHVGEIARRFGGGGHATSAAFSIKLDDPFFHNSHLELFSTQLVRDAKGQWIKVNRFTNEKVS